MPWCFKLLYGNIHFCLLKVNSDKHTPSHARVHGKWIWKDIEFHTKMSWKSKVDSLVLCLITKEGRLISKPRCQLSPKLKILKSHHKIPQLNVYELQTGQKKIWMFFSSIFYVLERSWTMTTSAFAHSHQVLQTTETGEWRMSDKWEEKHKAQNIPWQKKNSFNTNTRIGFIWVIVLLTLIFASEIEQLLLLPTESKLFGLFLAKVSH